MSGPNKILEFHEKILELSNNGFSSTKTKNIFQKNLETSLKNYKMDNFIQKDIHNPKYKFWVVTKSHQLNSIVLLIR